MILISFFSAFTVGLNKYATQARRDKVKIDRLIIVSEIMVHGVSGFIIGLVSTKVVTDPYILCAVSGIGGMIGRKLLYVVANNFIGSIMSVKDLDTKKIDEDED